MKRKIAASIMAFAMVLALLSACFRTPKAVEDIIEDAAQSYAESQSNDDAIQDDDSDSEDGNNEEDTDEPMTPASNPSEGYDNYLTAKSNAMDRITEASENADSMMTVAMGLLGVSMVDLSLITLTAFGEDLQASEMALAIYGLQNVEIIGSGNDYTITYTDAEGTNVQQTCKYDPQKDQMTSTLVNDDGTVAMFFEYVHNDDAYTAQYYYPTDDAYQIIRSYFDMDNVAAFGTFTASEQPSSILGQSGFNEEFVVNEESYMILKDGQLTVYGN